MSNKLSLATIVLAGMTAFGGAGRANCSQSVPDERTGAWKNFHGTHESSSFRVENGKGFDYVGEKHDEPCTPIVSRADWIAFREGRTFVLYDVDPGNLEPNGFHYMNEATEEFEKGYQESLWIGLLGEDGEIARKKRLGTGLRDISGIQTGADGRDFVIAVDVQGQTRTIPLDYPLPWPPLEQEGNAWERYNERIEREIERIGEDWPGNASGYAAQWQDNALQSFLGKERQQAVETLRTRPMTKACRACLEGEADRTWVLSWEATEGVADQSCNVHWGQVVASEERERFIYPYLRNWIEGFDHPGGWMLVCNARGEFNGEAFTATNGVALVGLEGWKNRTKEEEAINRWGLLRLAPEQVRKEDGKTFVGFELSMMDAEATLMSGAGRPLGKPFTIKRGASTRPMPMPPTPTAYYRLSYSNGRFTAQGRLDIPAVPRGEIRTLDIPNPTEGIHLQTPESPVAKPAPSASVPAAAPVAAPVSAKPISPPAPAPAPAATPARPSPSSSAAAPVLFVP